jgi:hypothetical protein
MIDETSVNDLIHRGKVGPLSDRLQVKLDVAEWEAARLAEWQQEEAEYRRLDQQEESTNG